MHPGRSGILALLAAAQPWSLAAPGVTLAEVWGLRDIPRLATLMQPCMCPAHGDLALRNLLLDACAQLDNRRIDAARGRTTVASSFIRSS